MGVIISKICVNTNYAEVYNSILAFDGAANVIAKYDKWRLVPGGEFLPFESILAPLGFRKIVTVPGSFAAGSGPATLTIAGAPPAGMLICYEAIFPDRLVDPNARPQWLINVTNDGWFGDSTGPGLVGDFSGADRLHGPLRRAQFYNDCANMTTVQITA